MNIKSAVSRYFIQCFLMLIFVLVCDSGMGQDYQFSSKSKKAIKHYNNSVKFYKQNQLSSALMSLIKATEADDKFIEAWLLIGDINSDSKNYETAINAYEKAISIDSLFFPPVYYFLGNIHYELGNYNESLKYLSKVLNIDVSSELLKLANERKLFAEVSFDLVNNPVNSKPVNIGSPINTINDEYINYVNTDTNHLFLTRRSQLPSHQSRLRYKEELYGSDIIDASWSKPELVDLEWRRDGYNIGTINFSTDGRQMFFTGCYWPDGAGGCDIYTSESIGNYWKYPENLGSRINTSTWESQPIVSSDGKKLFFASKRSGGKGGSDIWMSIKLKDGSWSPPVNLGDSINTSKDEMAPFLHADGQTLFFASTGHPGLGGYDLFVSRKDELGRWSNAKNIGYPTNSKFNEINIFSSIDGTQSWISSDREGGMGKYDIYNINNYNTIAPQELMYIEGFVVDKDTEIPLKAKVEITNLTNGELVNVTVSDSLLGNFLMVVFPGNKYAFNISKRGYIFYSDNIDIVDSIRSGSIKRKFELTPFRPGNIFVMNNIFFDFNSYELLSESNIELNKLVESMKQNPHYSIEITGHTDSIGTTEYNLNLSIMRAKAVGQYLINEGININRINYSGKGSSAPVATNQTELGRSKNRRTEILIK